MLSSPCIRNVTHGLFYFIFWGILTMKEEKSKTRHLEVSGIARQATLARLIILQQRGRQMIVERKTSRGAAERAAFLPLDPAKRGLSAVITACVC